MGCGASQAQGQRQPSKEKRGGGRASIIEAEAGLAAMEMNAFAKKNLGAKVVVCSGAVVPRIPNHNRE